MSSRFGSVKESPNPTSTSHGSLSCTSRVMWSKSGPRRPPFLSTRDESIDTLKPNLFSRRAERAVQLVTESSTVTLDDLVVEGSLAQDNWPVQAYVEVLEWDGEEVPPV